MKIAIVAGALANKCGNGGEAWVRLSWVLGLRRLGFRVLFLEQIDPRSCRDHNGRVTSFAESTNLRYFNRVCERYGLSDSACLIAEDGRKAHGLPLEQVFALADDADLLVNISGHLRWIPLLERIRRRIYVDIDPGFTQFWHASGRIDLGLERHHFLFTIGENIGEPDCPIPTQGLGWRKTRQPVVLDLWPESSRVGLNRFTTVATWRGPFGPISLGGKRYGLKVHEFRKFLALPRLASQEFELTLQIDPADGADLRALRDHGWKVVGPEAVADPDSFRHYVQGSGAEFSVAQGIYVETRSGWFSDRTVRYLASGKPALVQDTGFSRNLPVGLGLVGFSNIDEALAGARSIADGYEEHSRAARKLAQECFDSDRVLRRFLQEAGVSP